MPYSNLPFGPIDAGDFRTEEDRSKNYLDVNNEVRKNRRTLPSLIVGRRGAGKTALLTQLQKVHNIEFAFDVSMKTHKEFSIISNAIADMSIYEKNIETESEMWRVIVWRYLLISYKDKMKNDNIEPRDNAEKILVKYCIALEKKEDIGFLLNNIVDRLRGSPYALAGLVGDLISALNIDGFAFSEAQNQLEKVLDFRGWKGCLLIDTLEDFQVENLDRYAAFASLVYEISSFNTRHNNLKAVLCCPMEIYPFMKVGSPATVKAFRFKAYLRWKTLELIELSAKRLGHFIDKKSREGIVQLKQNFSFGEISYAVNNIDGCINLLYAFLPPNIKEPNGIRVETIVSIIRRTQLTPRQIIMTLNKIFSYGNYTFSMLDNLNLESGRLLLNNSILAEKNNRISENDIVYALIESSKLNCDDVIQSYQGIYPFLRKLCSKVLSKIFPSCAYYDAVKVIEEFNQRAMIDHDPEHLLNVLYEVGAIGVIQENDRLNSQNFRGFIADFSYIHSEITYIPDDSNICIHPMFSDVFCKRTESQTVIVFPVGTHFHKEIQENRKNLSQGNILQDQFLSGSYTDIE